MNTLTFCMINPVLKKEPWAVSYGKQDSSAIEIYLDGKEITAELCQGTFGHIAPGSLYHELTNALLPGTVQYKEGAELLCCGDCGMATCKTILAVVRKSINSITWTIGKPLYTTFRFRKNEYFAQMQQLKKWQDKTN